MQNPDTEGVSCSKVLQQMATIQQVRKSTDCIYILSPLCAFLFVGVRALQDRAAHAARLLHARGAFLPLPPSPLFDSDGCVYVAEKSYDTVFVHLYILVSTFLSLF